MAQVTTSAAAWKFLDEYEVCRYLQRYKSSYLSMISWRYSADQRQILSSRFSSCNGHGVKIYLMKVMTVGCWSQRVLPSTYSLFGRSNQQTMGLPLRHLLCFCRMKKSRSLSGSVSSCGRYSWTHLFVFTVYHISSNTCMTQQHLVQFAPSMYPTKR